MSKFPWDEKSIARMKELIEDCRSSNEAAAILRAEFRHPLSRSAVMGKSAALGLHFKSTNRNGRSTKCAAPAAEQPKSELAANAMRAGRFHWPPASDERLNALTDGGYTARETAGLLSVEFSHHLTPKAVELRKRTLALYSTGGRMGKPPKTVTSPKPAGPLQSGRTCVKRQVAQVMFMATTAALEPSAPSLVAAPPEPAPPPAVVEPAPAVAIPATKRVALFDLDAGACRWPIGDPCAADFGFCGANAPGAGPYCGYHAQIAYEPAQDRRRVRDQIKPARAA